MNAPGLMRPTLQPEALPCPTALARIAWSAIWPLPVIIDCRHRPAVEQDALAVVVAVVVVPVEAGAGVAGGQAQGVHGHGVAHVHLAGGDHAAVVHLAQQHARRDAATAAASRSSSAGQSRPGRIPRSRRPARRPAAPSMSSASGGARSSRRRPAAGRLRPSTFASPFSDSIRAKMSERSSVSTVMPWRCRASSSMRTVLKAVVRAPMAPTVMSRMPATTRQRRSK